MLQTEFAFTLPCGLVDDRGTLHRDGVMRLSTALDEIEAIADCRWQDQSQVVAATSHPLRRKRKLTLEDTLKEQWAITPKGTAPSNFSITGRYILQPEIFEALAKHERGAGGEIQLTDAMIELSRTQRFYGVEFKGERHDCGSKAGFLRANLAYGMARADLRDALRAEMRKYLGE